jgi:hypothetical protein
MEFVVLVVMTYFEMDKESAIQLMLEVHTNGFAKIGHSSREIMENFAVHLNVEARGREYPLFCTVCFEMNTELTLSKLIWPNMAVKGTRRTQTVFGSVVCSGTSVSL